MAPDPEKLDPSGANEGREERAELIEAANEADADAAKAEQAAADAASKPVKTSKKTTTTTVGGRQVKAKVTAERRTAPRHTVKRDDAGAREQQRAARENTLPAQLAELDGPPIVAPVVEQKAVGKFSIVAGDTRKKIKDTIFTLLDARVVGEDFPPLSEVIIDIRREDGQDHQRFSTWSTDGTIDVALPGVSGTGTWVVHTEVPVTTVGEGRDDHLPLIRESKPQQLEVR